MAWCHRCTTAATSLGKKILPFNMDQPTVPLPSSAVSHLPQIPSLPKNSVGTCQANYDPRGAAGLSLANALPNGILLITWMAGLTTGQTLHIISNNISVSKHNHILIHVVLLTKFFFYLLSLRIFQLMIFFFIFTGGNAVRQISSFLKRTKKFFVKSFLCCIPTQPKRSSHQWWGKCWWRLSHEIFCSSHEMWPQTGNNEWEGSHDTPAFEQIILGLGDLDYQGHCLHQSKANWWHHISNRREQYYWGFEKILSFA